MSNYPYASMRDSFDLSAYFVVGPQDCKGRPITDVIDDALRGGASFIQLRVKDADAKDLTDMARDIAQIIEDNNKSDPWHSYRRPCGRGLAGPRKGIKVDGVHIGQTDMEPREARALLGEDAIVGLVRRNGKPGQTHQRIARRLHRLYRCGTTACFRHQAGSVRRQAMTAPVARLTKSRSTPFVQPVVFR